ncbi:MAG: hypothetical protein M1482_11590 [Chloroflexi bacterium]|nr:hypothetical protein [Chloroflexota bacterium]
MPQNTIADSSPAQSLGNSRSPHARPAERPLFRTLRVFAFDPSLSSDFEYAGLNETIVQVPWEPLGEGPIGEYLEVVDVDPAGQCCYTPVNLDDAFLLAQNETGPSEANPQFHQQMVYAVAMTTIRNFERALGRTAFWAPHYRRGPAGRGDQPVEEYVQHLRVYPHALREANAYYSPEKNALLFGYFPAPTEDPRYHLPGGMVFTCLSHDIVAHETTHALLHGMHRRFQEPSNPDVLAFHEAFADIVALFQHFTLPQVVRDQIAKTRGDLALENLLFQLGQEFGRATDSHGALRDALGEYDERGEWKPKPADPTLIDTVLEPHARGSLLVAAVFDAFVAIFRSRIADLVRIASGGTGILPPGSLHPDLVERLAGEATKAAQHVLTMCIRALDYSVPVDQTFGDYMRALITADYDLYREDERHYRAAFVEAFRRRGIYPRNVRSLSVENLLWSHPTQSDFKPFQLLDMERVKRRMPAWTVGARNETIWAELTECRRDVHRLLSEIARDQRKQELHDLLRLDPARPFEVHSLRTARREGPSGEFLGDLIIEITQLRPGYIDPAVQKQVEDGSTEQPPPDFKFRGGCTLLVDQDTFEVRYCVYKNIDSESRLARQRESASGRDSNSLRVTYFGGQMKREPFAMLHRSANSPWEDRIWMP